MTGTEVLQSSFLEILFENRNKEYGAYALRRTYSSRLVLSVFVGIGLVFLLLLFFMHTSNTANAMNTVKKGKGVVLTVVNLPIPEIPKLPKRVVLKVLKKGSIANTPIDIVKDASVTPPTIEELVTNVSIDIVNNNGISGAALPPLPTGRNVPEGGNEKAIEKPVLVSSRPQFPGGQAAWILFLTRNLRTPNDLASGERKTVLVQFVVIEDGSVSQFVVVKSGGEKLDNEVIRVLKKMPRWKAAIQNGVAVKSTFTQPVTFESIEQ